MVEGSDTATEVRRLLDGYRVSQAMSVFATLGIADLLADGARTSDDLARLTDTHAPSLYRLLRALAPFDVVHELEDHRFELTALGRELGTARAGTLAGWAAFVGEPSYWAAWGDLLHTVRTGENAFTHVHGTDVWTYREVHPEAGVIFDRAMASVAAHTNAALLDSYDYSSFGTVADIGGGTGTFLAGVLAANPSVRGVLFDQAHVVAGAPAVLEPAGVAGRCEVVGGSFFDAVPSGADAYVLRAVLHDWSDDDAVRILEVVRRATSADATLLVVERVVDAPNEGAAVKLSDLNMLVSPGGRERTGVEFAELLERAGFRLERIVPGGTFNHIEGTPVA